MKGSSSSTRLVRLKNLSHNTTTNTTTTATATATDITDLSLRKTEPNDEIDTLATACSSIKIVGTRITTSSTATEEVSKLNYDVIVCILSHLESAYDIANAATVCQLWATAARCRRAWSRSCLTVQNPEWSVSSQGFVELREDLRAFGHHYLLPQHADTVRRVQPPHIALVGPNIQCEAVHFAQLAYEVPWLTALTLHNVPASQGALACLFTGLPTLQTLNLCHISGTDQEISGVFEVALQNLPRLVRVVVHSNCCDTSLTRHGCRDTPGSAVRRAWENALRHCRRGHQHDIQELLHGEHGEVRTDHVSLADSGPKVAMMTENSSLPSLEFLGTCSRCRYQEMNGTKGDFGEVQSGQNIGAMRIPDIKNFSSMNWPALGS